MWNNLKYIEPKHDFTGFASEEEYETKCRAWGLMGKVIKKEFLYRSKYDDNSTVVTIEGYEVHGTHETTVIRFQNGMLSCINPQYLKEMQKKDFGKDTVAEQEVVEEVKVAKKEPKATAPKAKEPKESSAKAIVLPENKISFKATVFEVTTRFNHFADKDEDIIIYDGVSYEEDGASTELGKAYSSVTKALAALELTAGKEITFDGKVVGNKKLNKEVIYKINNPSKVVVAE